VLMAARLSPAEREEIALGRAAGESVRSIARRLGRHPSTVSREVRPDERYGQRYRAGAGDYRCYLRSRRPKRARLATAGPLRAQVIGLLRRRWSPQQIAARLRADFPDTPEMWVSHETIYRALYVQGRGALRRELVRCLRTGRALRKPRRRVAERRGRIANMVNISQRPAEADDRAVPGHWEGDLIAGPQHHSAIGTLVERTTGFVMLLHLPEGRSAPRVAQAMIEAMSELPGHFRRSLTWDQGREMTNHLDIATAVDIDIYFCDPHSPWQRGTNENTNGLLRQYFPKGVDLAEFSRGELEAVAAELNARPRKRLSWQSPVEILAEVLSDPVLR
jgi:transposase, IS30 family